MADFSALLGKTLIKIDQTHDELSFRTADGIDFKQYHEQDCCEHVRIEEIIGDLSDLIGSPILQAEEVSSDDAPAPQHAESYTWTFYKLATIKGSVTIRWLGESNGYYSESVDFRQIAWA